MRQRIRPSEAERFETYRTARADKGRMHDGVGMTLEEIAQIEGVTRERIRQIEAIALKKLRRKRGALEILRGLAEMLASSRAGHHEHGFDVRTTSRLPGAA